MINITYEQFLNRFTHLLRSQDGILRDNHEMAGDELYDYLYFHHSYVAYALCSTTNTTQHSLIEPPSVCNDLLTVLKEIAPSITALDYQFLLLLFSEHSSAEEWNIKGKDYVLTIVNQCAPAIVVYKFLCSHNYIFA